MWLSAPVSYAEDFFNRRYPVDYLFNAIGMNTGAVTACFVFKIQFPGAFMNQRADFFVHLNHFVDPDTAFIAKLITGFTTGRTV
jgi:hypothetical protein